MILVDTSIWIDHLRRGSPALAALLQTDAVCTHVLRDRRTGPRQPAQAGRSTEPASIPPRPSAATEDEILFFIEQQQLMGRGIGYIDAHLLAAAVIRNVPIWTKDKRLKAIAEESAWAYAPGAH